MLGQIEVQTDEVLELVDEAWVMGEFEGLDPLRLEAVGAPACRLGRARRPDSGQHAPLDRSVRTGKGNDGTVSGLCTAATWIQQLAH
jgi:hypothetical protein